MGGNGTGKGQRFAFKAWQWLAIMDGWKAFLSKTVQSKLFSGSKLALGVCRNTFSAVSHPDRSISARCFAPMSLSLACWARVAAVRTGHSVDAWIVVTRRGSAARGDWTLGRALQAVEIANRDPFIVF